MRIDEKILRKSINLSSFENIKNVAQETNQRYVMHDENTFKGKFTRTRKTNQTL